MSKGIDVREYRYLIIGGTTRAATTSLFRYLSDHPEVCPSNMKETRFFLDRDYPLRGKYRFEEGLDKYDEFFCHCPFHRHLRMEATPHYLYSQNTPARIKNSLPSVKIVFALRDPISRLISLYKLSKQLRHITPAMSFESFVQEQIQATEKGLSRPMWMRTLEEGRYSVYLKPYFEGFKREDICVVRFEDICKKPDEAVRKICNFTGIASTFFEDYNFRVFNPTYPVRSSAINYIYWYLRGRFLYYIHNRKIIWKILRSINFAIEPLYLKLNRQPFEDLKIMPETKSFLIDYYRNEPRELERLIGEQPPWQLEVI